jgi:hypothetical protein
MNYTPQGVRAWHNSRVTARILGLAHDSLRTWRRKGKGPKFVRMRTRIAYLVDDINAWLDENRCEPSKPNSTQP